MHTIVQYLNSTYGVCPLNELTSRQKIKYYITKYVISVPPDLQFQLDQILQLEISQKPIFDTDLISNQVSVIKMDITQIQTDCIVNAANSEGLGCFQWGHNCIDNQIHNKAGPNLRRQCQKIVNGSKIDTGQAIITHGFNLPAKYIIHTVGPIYSVSKEKWCVEKLIECYENCLRIAINYGLKSIVFCCISTGVYQFPKNKAVEIAITTVHNFLKKHCSNIRVIFCTYEDDDYIMYKNWGRPPNF